MKKRQQNRKAGFVLKAKVGKKPRVTRVTPEGRLVYDAWSVIKSDRGQRHISKVEAGTEMAFNRERASGKRGTTGRVTVSKRTPSPKKDR